jgi:TP901 family phage tail tape measure protein
MATELARLGLVLETKKFLRETKKSVTAFDQLNKKAVSISSSMQRPGRAFDQLGKKADHIVNPLNRAGKAFDKMGKEAQDGSKTIKNKLIPAFQKLDRASSKLGPGFKSAFGRLGSLAKGVIGSIGRVVGSVFSLGGALAALPFVILGKKIIDMGASFEQGMAKAGAVMGATSEQMELLNYQAKELGRTTMFSASQAADALGFLGMAGFSAAESMQALPGVLQLATVGQLDLARAADIVSNAVTAMGLGTSEVGRINDVFAKTITSANVNMEMLAESFNYSASTAAATGISVEELSGLIGILGNAGIQGSRAGTALSSGMAKLLNPTSKAKETLSSLGVEIGQTLIPTLRGMLGAGASAADMINVFGLIAGRSLIALKTGGGMAAIDELTMSLKNSGGAAEELAKKFKDTFSGKMRGFKSAIEGLGIAVFEALGPDLRSGVEWMTTWVRDNQSLIVAFTTTLWDRAKNIFGSLKELAPVFKELGGQLFETFTMGIEKAGELGVSIINGANALTGFGDSLKPMVTAVSDTFGLIQTIFGNIWTSIKSIGTAIIDVSAGATNAAAEAMKGNFTNAWNIASQTWAGVEAISAEADKKNQLAWEAFWNGEKASSKFSDSVDRMKNSISASLSIVESKYKTAIQAVNNTVPASASSAQATENLTSKFSSGANMADIYSQEVGKASDANLTLASSADIAADKLSKGTQEIKDQAEWFNVLTTSAMTAASAVGGVPGGGGAPPEGTAARRDFDMEQAIQARFPASSFGSSSFGGSQGFSMSIPAPSFQAPNISAPSIDTSGIQQPIIDTTNDLTRILDRIRDSVTDFARAGDDIPSTSELAGNYKEAIKSVESAEEFFDNLQDSLSNLRSVRSGFEQLQEQIQGFNVERQRRDFGLEDFQAESARIMKELNATTITNLEGRLELNRELFDVTREIDKLEQDGLKAQRSLAKEIQGILGSLQDTTQDLYDEFARETPSENFERQTTRYNELRDAAISAAQQTDAEMTEAERASIDSFQKFSSKYLDSAREVFKSSATFGEFFDQTIADIKQVENKLSGQLFKFELSMFQEAITKLEETGFDFTKFYNDVGKLEATGIQVEKSAYYQSLRNIEALGFSTETYNQTLISMQTSANSLSPEDFIEKVAALQVSSNSLDATNAVTQMGKITGGAQAVNTDNAVVEMVGVTNASRQTSTTNATNQMTNISSSSRKVSTRGATAHMGAITTAANNVSTASATARLTNITLASNSVDTGVTSSALQSITTSANLVNTNNATAEMANVTSYANNVDTRNVRGELVKVTNAAGAFSLGDVIALIDEAREAQVGWDKGDSASLVNSIAFARDELKKVADNAKLSAESLTGFDFTFFSDFTTGVGDISTALNAITASSGQTDVDPASIVAQYDQIDAILLKMKASADAARENYNKFLLNVDGSKDSLKNAGNQFDSLSGKAITFDIAGGKANKEIKFMSRNVDSLGADMRSADRSTGKLGENITTIGDASGVANTNAGAFATNMDTVGDAMVTANTNTSGLVTNVNDIGETSTITADQLLKLMESTNSLGESTFATEGQVGNLDRELRNTETPFQTTSSNIDIITKNIDDAFVFLAGRSNELEAAIISEGGTLEPTTGGTGGTGGGTTAPVTSTPEPTFKSYYIDETAFGSRLMALMSSGDPITVPKPLGNTSVHVGNNDQTAYFFNKDLPYGDSRLYTTWKGGQSTGTTSFPAPEYLRSGTFDTGAPGPLDGGGIPAILHEHEMVIRKEHSPAVRSFMETRGMTSGYQGRSNSSRSYRDGSLNVPGGGQMSKQDREAIKEQNELLRRQNELLSQILDKEEVSLTVDAEKMGIALMREGRLVA